MNIRKTWVVQGLLCGLLVGCGAPSSLGDSSDPPDLEETQAGLHGETDWAQVGRTARRTSWNPLESMLGVSNVASLQEQWSVRAGYPAIALWDSRLFVSNTAASFPDSSLGNEGAGLSALSPETGAPLWSAPQPGDANGTFDGEGFTSEMSVAFGKIYIQHTNFSPVFSTETGRLLPADSSGMGAGMDSNFSSPIIKGSKLVLEAPEVYDSVLRRYRSAIEVIDTVSNELVWTKPLGAAFVISDPAVASGVVFAGEESTNALVAFDLATGQQRWASAAVKGWIGSPSVISGRVFVLSGPNMIHAYAEKTGALLWQTPFTAGGSKAPPSAFAQAPVLDTTSAYVALNVIGGGVGVGAFAAETGVRRWSRVLGAGTDTSSNTVLANGVLYVGTHAGTDSGKVFALNATTGAVLTTLSFTSMVKRMIVAEGRLFVATLDGVHAFGTAVGETPTLQ